MNKILRNGIIAAIVLGTVGTSSFYNYTYAKGRNAVEEGEGASADGESSVAIGTDVQAQGNGAVASGWHASATKSSIAIGIIAQATGESSIAFGDNVSAQGVSSIAFGHSASAQGGASIALGSGAKANEETSIAMGNSAKATGYRAVAFGCVSYANGKNSVAVGAWSLANDENEFSVGVDQGEDDDHKDALYRRVTHVADGVKDHDAVTLSQAKAFISGEIDSSNTTSSVTGAKIKAELDKKVNVDLDNLTTAGTSKVKTLAGEQIAATVTQDFVTGKVKKGNLTSDTLNVTGNGNLVGSDLKIDLKDGIVTKKKLSNDLKTEIENKANTSDLTAYAKTDATNITGDSLTKWQSALGNGTIAENNKGLVTGGTVHTALKGKANVDLDNLTDNGTNKVKTLAGEQIAATVTQDFVTEKVKKGNVSSTTLDVTGDGKMVGSDLKIDLKDGIVTKKKLSSDLKTEIENKANASDLNAYAKTDATNITGESLTKWQSALGNGTIAENNKGLVTGGTVHTALKGKANVDLDNLTDNGTNKVKTLAGDQITATVTQDFVTEKVKKGSVSSTTLDVTGNGKLVDSDLKIDLKDGIVTKKKLSSDLKTEIENKANTSDLSAYAKTDATNITGESLTKWQSALGNGTIAENNKGLVTGGTVHTAVQGKADKNAKNIEVLEWKKKLGLVDAQATQDSTNNIFTQITNINNDITNLKGGFIVSAGTKSKEITLGKTTKDKLTFASSDSNLTATFNEANKTISYGVNVANLIGDINKSDAKITNVDLSNNQTITNLKTEIQNITGGSGTAGSLSTKADTTANNLTKPEDILAWQKKLGIADNSTTVTPGSTATTTNLYTTVNNMNTTVNQLKAGYTVKAGTNTFDMKLGDTKAPTIEFAGDSTNGLDVAADKAGKKITYAINKEKLVKYIAGDLIKQMNGEGTPGSGNPSEHGTGEQGQTTPLPVLTNVSTGFNIAVGTGSKNFTFGKGKETNKLTFAGTNDETSVSISGEDGTPTVTVGLADTFKTKVNNKADKFELTELETKVKNITNGTTNIDGSKINLTTNNTFTTLQNTVNGKADTNANNLTKAEDILAWQKKLGLAEKTATVTPGSTATTTNLYTTVNQLKAGYTVKAGTNTFDMKLGDTTAPTIEFAGDSTNGLDVAADKEGKKITYTFNKGKLVKSIAGDLIKQMNGEGTGDPSGHGTGEQGQTTPLPVLTNVSTGFNIAVGDNSKNFTFGKGKETNKLTFAGTNDETSVSISGEDGTPTVTVGLADTFKTKVNNKADKFELTELETKVKNITNGTTKIDLTNIDLSTNNTFKALQTSVEGKANKNASNITVSDWATKLGTGEVATGNANLVTGGTVYKALQGKADKSALNDYAKNSVVTELETKVTNITKGTTKIDLTNIDLSTNNKFKTLQTSVKGKANADGSNVTTPATWAEKLGTGTVAENNKELVTGGTVYTVLQGKADKSALSDYAKNSAVTELETKVKNITNGTTKIDLTKIDLSTNNTFKTLQNTVEGKANKNASNITVSDWATKLGTGEVATGNANLVTGGTVYKALQGKADKSALSDYAKTTDLTELGKKVTDITNGTTKIDLKNIDLSTNNTFKTLQTSVEGKANKNASNITVSDWATKLGTGEVATGNANLVTGGTVYTALQGKADKSALSDYAKAIDLTELKTQVTNITKGTTKIDLTNIDLSTNNTFKALQTSVKGKANADGSNVTTPATWAEKLGTGTVAENNKELVTGGTVYTALQGKADKNAENIEVLAWKKKLGLVDAQATQDTANISTELSKIKNGFKISDGKHSNSIAWGTTAPVMTFKGDNGITATVNNTEITFKMDWTDKSAPKFHIYRDPGESSAVGRRRRVRSVEDTPNVPGTLIGSMDLDHLNMVFGKGLKAETKNGANGSTYTVISLAENTGMSKFTVKTDEKDKTTQKEKTFDVESGDSKAQLNVVGDGKNISTSIEKNNTVKVSLKDDVSINSLTAKTVTTDTVKVNDKVYLDKDGLHANYQVISDVKAGKEDSDAVNVAQLKALAGHTDKIGRAVGKLAVESRNGDALNAALSALRPLDYDPESKFDVSAGYGTYKGVHAVAVGTFYRPNATTLFSIGGSFTGGDSMMNAGVSFKVGPGSGSQTYLSRQAIASMLKRFSVEHEAMKNVLAEQDARTQAQIGSLQEENSSLKDKVNRLEKENNDRIEKANNRIAELERQVKEVFANMKK